jgi:tRNA modification GTPase
LIDTAGIRQHTHDVIESLGVAKSLEKMREADIVIYLFDVNEISSGELVARINEMKEMGLKYLLIGNKVDLSSDEVLSHKFANINVLFISAQTQTNLTVLKQRLVDVVIGGELTLETTIVTNARHYEALQMVQQSLDEIRTAMKQNVPGDLLSLDIRRCLHFLGEITGEITNEDQLDYIFSKFCIGK